jgi:amino-acid N-acetyltransferase
MSVIYRNATNEDVHGIHLLIQGYADKGIMLPRTEEMLASMIDTFIVAEIDGRLIGCGSLCQLGEDLVEIRSLGLHDEYKGLGIGGGLVARLIDEAKMKQMKKVMALTYEVSFFEKNGFSIAPKEIFPEKVWRDCVHCKKQYSCDEIAVLKRLDT